MFKFIKRYRRWKLYFKVARRKDRYAEFYVLLNGKLEAKHINKFCEKYGLNEEEKEIFTLYMKNEKINYIAEKLKTDERRINRILENIYDKTLQQE